MKAVESWALFEGIGYIDPKFVEEAKSPLKKEPAHPLWLRKAGALVAAFAAVLAMLFGINGISPAFAEGLPLVGEVFRHLNSLGANAPTYGGLVQAVGASGENGQYKVTVDQAYCDGEYIFFTLILSAKDAELLKMTQLNTLESSEGGAPGWDIQINGVSPGYTGLPVFQRKGRCFESSLLQVTLPKPVGNGAQLQVDITLGNLLGVPEEAGDKGSQLLSSQPVSLSFGLIANTAYTQKGLAQAAVDGLALHGWNSSPSKFSVTLAFPYFGPAGVAAKARAEDGTDLGEDLRESGDLEGNGYQLGDNAVQTCSFIGPPDNAEKVIVTVYAHQSSEQVFGEFTIDLKGNQASITNDYQKQGLQHMSIAAYAAAEKAKQETAGGPPPPTGSAPPNA